METIIIKMIFLMIIAYIIGSFPTGVIISKKFFGFDIRTKGSGNMGSTNIMRILGVKWGILVQVIDLLKGFIAVILLADIIGHHWQMFEKDSFLNLPILEIIIGISAILGHIFSCFIGFKGGKGINTLAGVLIAVMPIELGIGISIFILTVGISGYVSLGSMIGSTMIPLVLFARYNFFNVNIKGYFTLIYFSIGMVLLVYFTHKSNIVKLIKGTENKMEQMQFIRKLFRKTKEKVV